MNTTARFRRAWYIRPPAILGVQMQPFSIAHAYFLDSVESPYARGGVPDVDDFLLALMVCSTPADALVAEFFDARGVEERAADFAAEIYGSGVSEHDLSAFLAYIESYTLGPRHIIWKDGKDRRKPNAPWAWALVHRLVANRLAPDVASAWAMPLTVARCWHSVIAEANGDDSLTSDHWNNLADGIEQKRNG